MKGAPATVIEVQHSPKYDSFWNWIHTIPGVHFGQGVQVLYYCRRRGSFDWTDPNYLDLLYHFFKSSYWDLGPLYIL